MWARNHSISTNYKVDHKIKHCGFYLEELIKVTLLISGLPLKKTVLMQMYIKHTLCQSNKMFWINEWLRKKKNTLKWSKKIIFKIVCSYKNKALNYFFWLYITI